MGKSKKRVPIDELLDYWTDLSKRSTLTLKDFALFFERAKATRSHFSESYPYMRDKFFDRIDFLPFYQGRLLKAATEKKRLSNNDYAQIKNAAKNFIPRIKRWFGADIIAAVKKKTPPQDAEALLATSTKLTYRWAAGIIASNHIANLLIQLSRFRSGEKYRDDIMTLYENLKNRTTNPTLKSFLTKSYQRFKDADTARNRSAHVNMGEPTDQEIKQSIALARLLQKYVARK